MEFFLSEFRTKTSAAAPINRMTRLVRTGPYDATMSGMGLLAGEDDQYVSVSVSCRSPTMITVCLSLPRMSKGMIAQTI